MKKLSVFLALALLLASLGCNLPVARGEITSEAPAVSTRTSAIVTEDVVLNTPLPPTPTQTEAPTNTPANTPTLEPPPVVPLTIAFLENGDAYVWREGGMTIRLTATGDVNAVFLAPDASSVLFKRGTPYNEDLWAINVDGSDMRLLFSDAAFDALVPGQQNYLAAYPFPPGAPAYDFIPGTTQIAFITGYTFEGPGMPSNHDLQIVDYVSGVHTTLLPPGSGAGALDYSPDGQWVALIDGDQIEVMRADGSDRRVVLTFPFVYTYSEWAYYPKVFWRADSSGFRVIIPAQDPLGDPTAPSHIYSVGTDGTVVELGQFVGMPVFISFPTLAPNSEFFAYLSESTPGSGIFNLHIASLDMSYDNLVFTGSQLQFIGWSSDSNVFLFWQDGLATLNVGSMGSAPFAFASGNELRGVNWVSSDRFLATFGTGMDRSLRLYSLDRSFASLSGIASDVDVYDYAPKP